MTNPNCGEINADCGGASIYRPSEVQEMFDIKQRTYYDRLKFLKLEAHKDNEGKSYLDKSQINLLEELDNKD